MNLKTLILLLVASTASAQHPRDFVADGALSVLSIQNGNAVNAIIETIYEESRSEYADASYLNMFLAQLFEDPTAVDLSQEFLLAVEPTVLADGQRPSGMFGPMPHLLVVCKAKEGRALVPLGSLLKSSEKVDGWFVASGADAISIRTKKELSPIFAQLPDAQIGNVIRFGPLWRQLGPIAQMMGGMFIGSMNKPGIDGVISKETRMQSKAARGAFQVATAWCGKVEIITVGLNIENFELTSIMEVEMKEADGVTVDNDSLMEMASYFVDNSLQYGMSKELTLKLFALQQSMIGQQDQVLPLELLEGIRFMAENSGEYVVGMNLDSTNGLAISALNDVSDQGAYLKGVSEQVTTSVAVLAEELFINLSASDAPFSWNISMKGTSAQEQQVMDSIVHKGDQLRFKKQGSDRVAMLFGPKSWRAFAAPHASSLSQVMRPHANSVAIDLACSIDARKLIAGFLHVANQETDEPMHIATSPSARNSLLFGSTNTGMFIELKSNLLGLAKLAFELNNGN